MYTEFMHYRVLSTPDIDVDGLTSSLDISWVVQLATRVIFDDCSDYYFLIDP